VGPRTDLDMRQIPYHCRELNRSRPARSLGTVLTVLSRLFAAKYVGCAVGNIQGCVTFRFFT